jgi:predicted acetyltransferase
MKDLSIENCREQNMGTLIALRRRQIAEETNQPVLSDSAIEKQIQDWINSGHQAFFLKWDSDIIGFAVIDTQQTPFSLKYFYAARNFRRSGMKVLDFRKLIDLLDTDALEVKISARNTSSRLFWETFGFKEQSLCLRYSRARAKTVEVGPV